MNQVNSADYGPRRFRLFFVCFVVLLLGVFSFSDGEKHIVNAHDEAKFLTGTVSESVADPGIIGARSLGNTTLTFQDGVSGYTGTRDTYFYNVSPATVRGAENLIIQDKNPANVPEDERTSLLQFDLSAIPTNSTIVSAQLDFYVDSEGQGFNMYRMKVPWDEATASFASIGSRHFVTDGVDAEIARSEFWPGVDGYVGPITVSVSPSTISDWVNGVMVNNGWLMVSAHADDGVQLRSSEHATIANRPKLTVVYNETPPNFAPAQTVVVSPVDGASDVSTSPNLEVSVADPNADNLTVTYYGRAPSTTVPGADFTIIAMPDTQHYTDNGGANAAQFAAQTQWIVDNKDALNIRFVSGLGDIVQNGNALDSEWLIASNAYATIEDPVTTNLLDGIPYGLVVGNHDQTPIGGGNTASTAKFNQYFGISRFAGRAYYGGHYGSDNDNNFELFSGGGHNYIALHLEFDPVPLPAVVAWADNLLQTYSDRRAIVSTHHAVGIGFPAVFSSQATTIYNTLRNRPNFFLFLGGHIHGEGRRQDTFQGRTVWSILSDYQSRPNGGNGLLRIMTFSPANNTISVQTYSPTLGQFETDYDSQFTLPYDMSGSPPFTVIGTNTGVPSGTNTSLNWPGLTAGTEYEWYATFSDGTLTTTGPVWSFTTGPVATPTNTSTATATDTPTPTNTSTNTPTPCLPPGSLDTSFDGDGIVVTPIGNGDDQAYSIAIQNDGKIVTAGSSYDGANQFSTVVRYDVAGNLDTSFDGDGMAISPITGGARSVAIQSDGKIVVGGNNTVMRYTTNGTLDPSFDLDGIVTTGSGRSLAIQSDGKIVATGGGGIFRFTTNGDLDPSFGSGGVAPAAEGISVRSIAIQQDGRIVLAGFSMDLKFAVVRYNADGTFDTSFDGDGIVVTPRLGGSNGDHANSVAIQSDGKIVAAGVTARYGIALFRYNANGTLDTSFDYDGNAITYPPPPGGDAGANSNAIQSDGKIVVTGFGIFGLSTPFIPVVRYNVNGSLDSSFDDDGIATTFVGNSFQGASSLVIQPDAKIVIAGERYDGTQYDSVLVRYNGAPCGSPTATSTVTPTITSTSTPTDTPTDTPTTTPTDTPTNTPTPPAVISGTVTYANAVSPRYVSNVVMSGVGSPGVSGTTDFPGGNYSLTGFGSGSYTVTPVKTGGQNGGVSSFDAARIAQFVSSLTTFSAIQQTVAEVSGNGGISSFDAALVASYAVALDGGSAGSWRFDPVNRIYPSVTTDITGENYLALLMGEVSGNWTNTASRTVVGGQWSVGSEESVGSSAAPTYLRRSSASPVMSDPAFVALPPAAEPQNSNWGSPEKHSFSANRTAEPWGTVVRGQLSVVSEDIGHTEKLITVTTQHLAASADKEIIIPLSVQGVAEKGIIAYEFDLRYDPSVIQPHENPVDVAGTVSRGLFALANAVEPGLLRVVVYGAMPIDSDGVLLNLKFKTIGAGGSALTFERIMFNEGEARIVLTEGLVQVSAKSE